MLWNVNICTSIEFLSKLIFEFNCLDFPAEQKVQLDAASGNSACARLAAAVSILQQGNLKGAVARDFWVHQVPLDTKAMTVSLFFFNE